MRETTFFIISIIFIIAIIGGLISKVKIILNKQMEKKEKPDIKNVCKTDKVVNKNELEEIIKEYDSKTIWWKEEDIVNSEKIDKEVTIELVKLIENKLGHKLPNSYIELLKTQNGGRLKKRYYVVKGENNEMKKYYEMDAIWGITDEDYKGIVYENDCLTDWSDYYDIKNVVAFGSDISAGHAHYLFDYTDLNENNEPRIIFYDNEIEKKELLANSFDDFIKNLKIEEELMLGGYYEYFEC